MRTILLQGRIMPLAISLLIGVTLCVALFVFMPTHAAQTIPYKMNFQGRLTDNAGNIMADGLYNMQFRIYDASSAGTQLWGETRETTARIQVTNGLFSIQLGDVTALPPGIFNSASPRYFEITLATPATATCSTAGCAAWESPMTPRQALGSAGYAMNADTVDGIDGDLLARRDTNNIFSGNSNIFRNGTDSTGAFAVQNAAGSNVLMVDTANGRVGVGRASTGGSLEVQNNIRLWGAGTFGHGTRLYFGDNSNVGDASSAASNPWVGEYGTVDSDALQLQGRNGMYFSTGDFEDVAFSLSATGEMTFKNSTNSTTAFQIQNAAASTMLTMDTTNGKLTVNQGGLDVRGLANPAAPSLTSAGTGGSLAAGTYTYRLAATGPAGETQAVASSPANVTTTGTTSVNTLSWTAVANATGYAVYRSTDGGTTWFVNNIGVVTSLTDNGSNFSWTTAPAAGKPSLFDNTTGDIYMQGGATLRLNTNGSSTLKNDTAGNSTVLGNYSAGGVTIIQGDQFQFQDTTGYNANLHINNSGATTFKNRVNSTAAFQVQNAAGSSILSVDTSNGRLNIGGATPVVDSRMTVKGVAAADAFAIEAFDSTKKYALTVFGNDLRVGEVGVDWRITLMAGGNMCIGLTSCSNKLAVSGNIAATGTITGGVGAPDYAENITASDLSIEAADVVSLDPVHPEHVVKSSGAYDATLLGVISTNPGFITNAQASTVDTTAATDHSQRPLALVGRVPVKVTNENGQIAPGDYLTSSSTPGYAMKATKPGVVIGKALESFTGTQGKVLVFINTHYFDPTRGNELQGTSAEFKDINVSGSTVVNQLTVTGIARVAQLVVEGHITGNPDTRGRLTIPAGSRSVSYTFNAPYETKPYVVISPENQSVAYRIEVSITGLVIRMDGAQPQDIVFTYMVQR